MKLDEQLLGRLQEAMREDPELAVVGKFLTVISCWVETAAFYSASAVVSFWRSSPISRSPSTVSSPIITKSHGPSSGPLTQTKSSPPQAEATTYWLQSARSPLHGLKVTAIFDPLRTFSPA